MISDVVAVFPNGDKIFRYKNSEDGSYLATLYTKETDTVLPLFTTTPDAVIQPHPTEKHVFLESTTTRTRIIVNNHLYREYSQQLKWFSKDSVYSFTPFDQCIDVFDLQGKHTQKIEGVEGKVLFAFYHPQRDRIIYISESEEDTFIAECFSNKCEIYPIGKANTVAHIFLNGDSLFIINKKKEVKEYTLAAGSVLQQHTFARLKDAIKEMELTLATPKF